MTMTDDIYNDVWVGFECKYCGAFGKSKDGVKHYKTCFTLESSFWFYGWEDQGSVSALDVNSQN
jgi:hypothetical protein